MRSLFRSLPMLLLLATPAGALLTDDESSNDDVSTASIQVVKTGGVTVEVGRLSLVAGDLDYLGIASLESGDAIMVSTTPLEDAVFERPDTIVGIFDDRGSEVCVNDDVFNNDLDDPVPFGKGSLCRFLVTQAGDYYVGVTGWSNSAFDGTHIHSGEYRLSVTVTADFDTDGDGTPDSLDADDDNDGVADELDANPKDPTVCEDTDADLCDDCSVGTDGFGPLPDSVPADDGTDTDVDGVCDVGDPDDDGDGVPDELDPCPLDPVDNCAIQVPATHPAWLVVAMLAAGIGILKRERSRETRCAG